MNQYAPVASLALSGLSVHRPDGTPLLREASLTLGAGETVLLLGPVGSGKSTLLGILAGLRANGQAGWRVAGRLDLAQRSVDLSRETHAAGALVFQDHALFEDLSVAENVAIALPRSVAPSRTVADLVASLLAGIAPQTPVAACSGGQKQLVAIARTLISEPQVLLFDEPNAGLDAASEARLVATLQAIRARTRCPMLITAHHVGALLPLATHVLYLDPETKTLQPLARDATQIEAQFARTAAAGRAPTANGHAAAGSGAAAPLLPRPRSRLAWFGRFLGRYCWLLCFSPAALLYMALGGLLVGFVSTWFTVRHFPLADYLAPLFEPELLSSIGYAQLRVLVPLIAALLLAARGGAIVAADQGQRVHARQIEAMRNLRIPVALYLTAPIVLAMWISFLFLVSAWVSLGTWTWLFPQDAVALWKQHFYAGILPEGARIPVGAAWIVAKSSSCALAVEAVSIACGRTPKESVLDLNRGVALAITLTIAAVLLIHTGISLLEF